MNRRGFSLIELLTAMIITGIVSLVVIQMISGESRHYTTTRGKIKLQSDTREAVRIIEEELRNVGFRIKSSVASGILTSSSCGNSYATSGRIAFFSPHARGIEFRLYNPFQGGTSDFDCDDDLHTLSYSWDSANGLLLRKYAKGKAPDMSAVDSVPFLENVIDFRLQYGIFRSNAALLTPAELGSTSLFASNVAANVASDSMMTITGWNTTTGSVIALKNLGQLDSNATYRIAFTAYASDGFLDPATGFESLKIGFFLSGSPTSSVFTFRPGTSAGAGDVRSIQYDLSPTDDALGADVRLGIIGRMKGAASNPSLTVGSVRVTRINDGKIANWVDGTDTTAPWDRIGAIRLQVAVRNSKDTLRFMRTIPVVNNDGTN